jgi:hypothetical protein
MRSAAALFLTLLVATFLNFTVVLIESGNAGSARPSVR